MCVFVVVVFVGKGGGSCVCAGLDGGSECF